MKLLFFLILFVFLHSNVKAGPEIPGAELLPKGKGRNEVIMVCSGCHSLKLVAQNRMSRRNWDLTLTWMQKNHNLWAINKKQRKILLDYFERHLAPGKLSYGQPTIRNRQINPLSK